MKATGIVRRIDDLGRVVIPKEIRRTLRIREGDALEIFTDRDGAVILKKYSPVGEITDFAGECAEAIYGALGCTAAVSDKDMIVAAGGPGRRELTEKPLSGDIDALMKRREKAVLNKATDSRFYSVTGSNEPYTSQVVVPIIAEGDAVGSVILLSKEERAKMGAAELKVAETVAGFIGRQMES